MVLLEFRFSMCLGELADHPRRFARVIDKSDASLASRDCKPFTGGTQERWQPYE